MEATIVRKTLSETIADTPLLLVDFYTQWCGPCKMMAPVLKDLKLFLQDNIKVIKIDVDKNNAAAAQFQIAGVPTLILFKNGQPVWRQSGAMNLAALKAVIEQHG